MGYHHCPIEPNDWSDGPDYQEDKDCPDCDNGRVNREAMTIDGVCYPAIVDQKCETCDGCGTIPSVEFDD
tara:strand:- start:366 stop:575 length:210 start_codon:yes stop_codon:yes gene_type:complete